MAFLSPSIADEQPFTAGASPFTPVGGVWNDALAALTAGQQGELRITEKRAAHVNLRNETGTEIGTSAAPLGENLVQLAGTAVDVNSGNKSAGTQRVVLATDQPTPANPFSIAVQRSGNVLQIPQIADLISFSNLTTNAASVFVGSPRFYIASILINVDPLAAAAVAGGGFVSITENGTVPIFACKLYLPGASPVPANATLGASLSTGPGFFFRSTINASALSISITPTLTVGSIFITIAYGLTT